MANSRGRNRHEFGALFTTYNISGPGAAPIIGQPVMVRMQGVPTMPGYRDRIGKWNALIPPLFLIEIIREYITKILG